MDNERQAIERAVLEKIWKEPEFKRELKENPRAALAKMNLNIPDYFEIELVEEPRNKIIMVIPYEPPEDGELTDEELEAVAGGKKSKSKSNWSNSTGYKKDWSGSSTCCITGNGC